MTEHRCVRCVHNLDELRTYPQSNPGIWYCKECDTEVSLWEVVEALRERAVARDAAYRLAACVEPPEESL